MDTRTGATTSREDSRQSESKGRFYRTFMEEMDLEEAAAAMEERYLKTHPSKQAQATMDKFRKP